jgi:hypothetical protein
MQWWSCNLGQLEPGMYVQLCYTSTNSITIQIIVKSSLGHFNLALGVVRF